MSTPRARAAPGRRTASTPVPPAGAAARRSVRPRYGRLAVLGAALAVTGIARARRYRRAAVGRQRRRRLERATVHDTGGRDRIGRPAAGTTPSAQPVATTPTVDAGPATRPSTRRRTTWPTTTRATPTRRCRPTRATGKRVVFSQSDQRVWLVDEDDDGRADLPGLGQPLPTTSTPAPTRSTRAREQAVGHRRLRDDGVLRPLHPGRQRRARSASTTSRSTTASPCRPSPSSARRSRTAASARSAPTPSRCGTSPRSAPRSTSSPSRATARWPSKRRRSVDERRASSEARARSDRSASESPNASRDRRRSCRRCSRRSRPGRRS